MFANAPRDREREREQRRELEEIVEDIPSNNNVVDGPASIAQRSTCKIISSNPDDLNRIKKIKHFQEFVVGVAQNGVYFVVESLERMFPEGAPHTKLLLGSSSAIKLLTKNGATLTNDSRLGQVLNFMVDSLNQNTRGFQDPFSACDLSPAPLSSLPSSSLGPPISSPSGLMVGANVNVGFWRTFLIGKGNIWDTLVKTGVKPFFYGLVVGFVDEILGSLVPDRYKPKLNYIKNLFKGASALIGTSVLCVMIVNSSISPTTAILTVLISYVGNLVGGAIGATLGNLLEWVMRNYFPNSNSANSEFCLPQHIDLPLPVPLYNPPINAALHNCGQENNGYIYVGLCINCNNQPALFGFVHKGDDVAHSAFCLNCSPLYRRPMCVCCADISSTYYFAPTAVTCAAKTCIRVADCVKCDEEGRSSPNTACIWRLKKSEETYLSMKTVTLDMRYCSSHPPTITSCDISLLPHYYFVFFFSF